jgi:hypothetical protein
MGRRWIYPGFRFDMCVEDVEYGKSHVLSRWAVLDITPLSCNCEMGRGACSLQISGHEEPTQELQEISRT